MGLNFVPLSLDLQRAYADRLAVTAVRPSLSSFVSLWAWRHEMGLSWAWEDDLVWIRASWPEVCLLPPVGNWDAVDWAARLRQHFDHEVFCSVPTALAFRWQQALPEGLLREDQRWEWDYLYRADDLLLLRGNQFMKKRHKIKEFFRDAGDGQESFSITGAHLDELWAFQERWLRTQEDPGGTLAAEHRAIREVFDAWPHLPTVRGSAIRVRGALVAYAVGALLAPTTLVVHFEKGDTALRGVYQAINQTFVRHHARFPVSLVNREEDLGDPGLRQAKLSYRPVNFVRKERIALRPALCPMDTAPDLSSCGEEVFSPH